MDNDGRWSCGDPPAPARAERRSAPRRPARSIPGLGTAGILAGPEVRLLNISRAGALVESEVRLSTGLHLCLRLHAADAVFLLKGRVLRSRTITEGGRDIRYESAVAFDEDFVLLDEKLPAPADHAGSGTSRRRRDRAGKAAPGALDTVPLGDAASSMVADAFLARRSGADVRRLLDLEVK